MKTLRRIKKFSKYILKGNLKKIYQDILEYKSDKQSIKMNQISLEKFEFYTEIFSKGVKTFESVDFLKTNISKCTFINQCASVLITTIEDVVAKDPANKIILVKNASSSTIPDALFYWACSAEIAQFLHDNGISLSKIFIIDSMQLDYSISRFFLSVGVIRFEEFLEINTNHNPFLESKFVCLSLNEYCLRQDKFLKDNCEVIKKLNIKIFNGLRHTLGWVGCGLSYKYLIFKARQFNLDEVIVCEDDVLFGVEFLVNYFDILDLLSKTLNWDVFSGFMVETSDDIAVNHKIFFKGMKYLDVKYFVSTVFNIYNLKLYDKILHWEERNFDKATNTIDRFISTIVENVIVPCQYPVSLNDTNSTLWVGGIDRVYRLKAKNAQDVLLARFNG